MNIIKKQYNEQIKKFSIFERFIINTGLLVLLLLIVFKWFVHIRLTVMDNMKLEFRYKDYVVKD